VAVLLEGSATAEGTARYAARFAHLPGHFGALDGLALASVGLGTYLGREDDATDRLYEHAVERAVERGINVVDSAINYRHQRSERAIGAALRAAISRGALARDEVFVATKGGYIPFDAAIPADPRAWFAETYLRPGIVFPDDVVGGAHCMTPRYLLDQLERSRANLGLATLDLYYVHNPEGQLDEVDRDAFMARIRDAFDALEGAVRDGTIRRYGTATWNGYRVDASEPGHLSLAELVRVAREVGGEDHHFGAIQLPYNLAMPEAFARATQRIGDACVSGSPDGGVAHSTSTPAHARGCRNAICPASPLRGAVSISSTPLSLSAVSDASMSRVSKQRWWSPSPRRARNRPTGVVSPSGSSSSISVSPAPSSAARTPCSGNACSFTSGRPRTSR